MRDLERAVDLDWLSLLEIPLELRTGLLSFTVENDLLLDMAKYSARWTDRGRQFKIGGCVCPTRELMMSMNQQRCWMFLLEETLLEMAAVYNAMFSD